MRDKEEDYLSIRKSCIKGANKGLFTERLIHRGEIIAYFRGEILSQREMERRTSLGLDDYFIETADGRIMDCRHVESFAKYANDALGHHNCGYRNNSRIDFDNRNRLCLVASRNIRPGSEIFCNYGNHYWKVKEEKRRAA